MGFPKWLKPVGKVAAEVGKVAGQAALQAAGPVAINANPAIGVAVQLATAFSNSEHGITDEQIKVLNTVLIPRGYMVVALPKE